MSDADWDADDFEPVEVKPPAPSDKWIGEDEDNEPKDNWDDEGDEGDDKKKEQPATTLVTVKKKKKPIGERVKEKEEKRKKELEEKLKKEAEEEAKLTPEEISDEKKRQERLQLESDLELAKDAFGLNDDELAKPTIDRFNPVSKSDFEELAALLKDKLTKYESSVSYPGFLEMLFRDLVTGLSSDDIKKLGSTLNAVANEKQKQERNVKSKKKKKGPSVKEGGQLDNYGDDYFQEYEDFM